MPMVAAAAAAPDQPFFSQPRRPPQPPSLFPVRKAALPPRCCSSYSSHCRCHCSWSSSAHARPLPCQCDAGPPGRAAAVGQRRPLPSLGGHRRDASARRRRAGAPHGR